MTSEQKCSAFEGARRIATGELAEVVLAVKAVIDRGAAEPILIFDDATARLIEIDFRGSAEDVRRRIAETGDGRETKANGVADAVKKPGRPRLGVVGREVTLLPRHWEWLNSQPGGASVALRRLVDDARRTNEGHDHKRKAQDAAYRFMHALAGDFPAFEEALRALFAGDGERFRTLIEAWPPDVRDHAAKMSAPAF